MRRPASGPVPASSRRGGPRASEVPAEGCEGRAGGGGTLLGQRRSQASSLHRAQAGERGVGSAIAGGLQLQPRAGPRGLGAAGLGLDLSPPHPIPGEAEAGAGAGGPGKLEDRGRKSAEVPREAGGRGGEGGAGLPGRPEWGEEGEQRGRRKTTRRGRGGAGPSGTERPLEEVGGSSYRTGGGYREAPEVGHGAWGRS